jgi:hypothetical protein
MNAHITKYETVHALNAKDFDHQINKAIRLGFQPYGVPFFAINRKGELISFVQTLVSEGTPQEVEAIVQERRRKRREDRTY